MNDKKITLEDLKSFAEGRLEDEAKLDQVLSMMKTSKDISFVVDMLSDPKVRREESPEADESAESSKQYRLKSVSYRQLHTTGADGEPQIKFEFDYPDDAGYAMQRVGGIMLNHRSFKASKPSGLPQKADAGPNSSATGLHVQVFIPKPCSAWVMPDNELNREVAASIDQALSNLGIRKVTAVEKSKTR